MPGWLTLNGFVLLIDLMLLGFTFGKRIQTAQDKAFSHLLGIVLVLLVADSLSRLDQSLAPGFPERIMHLGTYLTFAFDPLGYLFTLSYIDSWITPSTSTGKLRLRNAFVGTFVAYAILNFSAVTISQLFGLGWFYSFPNDVYTRGPLYTPRGVTNMLLCLVVGFYVMIRRRDIRGSYRSYILAFPLIVLFSGFMQVFVGGAAYEYAGTIFASLLLYLYVQDHNMDVDHLTGLLNRRGIDRELEARKIRDDRNHAFAACMIDLDYFKEINDTYGHEAGDDALRLMAELLTHSFNAKYHVGRFGGDEFLVLSNVVVAVPTGTRLCREAMQEGLSRLHELCDQANASGTHPWKLSFSAGTDILDPSKTDMSVDAFLAHIDELMYDEKQLRHGGKAR